MYRKSNSNQMVFDFHLPFGGELNPENRWIVLANVIPWDQIDSEYATLFDDSDLGCPGKPSRVALGALVLKERPKPRTYRQKARSDYLALAKQKKPSPQKIRKAIRKQLGYLRRNLKTIEEMAEKGLLVRLDKRLYRLLLVIQEVYRQQLSMYQDKSHRIEDRIVSLYQPHVRPIVRGKVKSPVEFGAKISISLVEGFSFVDVLSWDAYNESGDLRDQIESYHRRYGYYPEVVLADKIYRTRENRAYCKALGIRLSGPALGRPKQVTESNKEACRAAKRQRRQDEIDRTAVEGKFGQGKRRFSLNRIMAKLAETSEAAIMVSFIVMNLEKILRDVFLCLFGLWLEVYALLHAGDRAEAKCLRHSGGKAAHLPAYG